MHALHTSGIYSRFDVDVDVDVDVHVLYDVWHCVRPIGRHIIYCVRLTFSLMSHVSLIHQNHGFSCDRSGFRG
jgi:hypothetical protein